MRYQYTAIFFFNDTATTEIYTLSLHDALPISHRTARSVSFGARDYLSETCTDDLSDRKSTRLNSSHSQISYAVFCLKKKKSIPIRPAQPLIRLEHCPPA